MIYWWRTTINIFSVHLIKTVTRETSTFSTFIVLLDDKYCLNNAHWSVLFYAASLASNKPYFTTVTQTPLLLIQPANWALSLCNAHLDLCVTQLKKRKEKKKFTSLLRYAATRWRHRSSCSSLLSGEVWAAPSIPGRPGAARIPLFP